LSGNRGAPITGELDALIFTPTAGERPQHDFKKRPFHAKRSEQRPTGVPVADTFTTVIDSDPSAASHQQRPVAETQAAKPSVWDMNGTTLVGGGAVTPKSRGQAWKGKAIGNRRLFNGDGPFRHPVAENNQHGAQALDLGDERGIPKSAGGKGQSQSRGQPGKAIGDRRLQWRRLFSDNPVAETRTPARPSIWGNERGPPKSAAEKGQSQSRDSLEKRIGTGDFKWRWRF